MATTDNPKPLRPAEILEYNQAFADSLIALNKVTELQQDKILNMVIDGLKSLIQLCKDADIKQAAENAIKDIKNIATAASTTASTSAQSPASPQTATPSAPLGLIPQTNNASPENEYEFMLKNMLHALGIAQENAVSAIRNLDMIGQAALNQLIESINSIVDAVVAVQQAKQ